MEFASVARAATHEHAAQRRLRCHHVHSPARQHASTAVRGDEDQTLVVTLDGRHQRANGHGLITPHPIDMHHPDVGYGAARLSHTHRLSARQIRLLQRTRILAVFGPGLLVGGTLERGLMRSFELIEIGPEVREQLIAEGGFRRRRGSGRQHGAAPYTTARAAPDWRRPPISDTQCDPR